MSSQKVSVFVDPKLNELLTKEPGWYHSLGFERASQIPSWILPYLLNKRVMDGAYSGPYQAAKYFVGDPTTPEIKDFHTTFQGASRVEILLVPRTYGGPHMASDCTGISATITFRHSGRRKPTVALHLWFTKCGSCEEAEIKRI